MRVPMPSHRSVLWATMQRQGNRTMVSVRCPECWNTRWEIANRVRRSILQGTFTGLCEEHAAAATERRRQSERSPEDVTQR